MIIDIDALDIDATGRRCDCLFIGADESATYVAPIELKSGRFKGSGVVAQIQGGADVADRFLPDGQDFRFVPVLAHGRGVHPQQLQELRRARVQLRGKTRQVAAIHCGDPLTKALRQSA